ncbi:MAG: hypothetical protein HY922_01210 [Elusimicrobia bacterium]|nr:hypothetical protein [Elusimicrobiota bacterium]
MRPFPALLVAAFLANSAYASDVKLLGATGFDYVGIPQILALDQAGPPAFKAEPQDKIDKMHLLPRCGKSALFGYADTEAQAAEGIAMWTQILSNAGIKAGKPAYENGMYLLPYEASGGVEVREFMAEPRQFKPKDEQSLRENMAMVAGGMGKRGIPVIASYVVDLEFMLPTYSVYYLAKAEESRERETQVRVLKPGEDIDFDLLEKAGVDILQKPETWMMVYIGREVGFVSRIAKSQEEAEKKLKERVDLLTGMGKTMIGSRILPLAEPYEDYRFLVNIYFYQ